MPAPQECRGADCAATLDNPVKECTGQDCTPEPEPQPEPKPEPEARSYPRNTPGPSARPGPEVLRASREYDAVVRACSLFEWIDQLPRVSRSIWPPSSVRSTTEPSRATATSRMRASPCK